MKKLTKKELFKHIAEVLCDDEAVVAFCEKEIETLDSRAEKAKTRAAEKRAAGDELTSVVASVLTTEAQTIADIAAQIEGEDVTVSKVAYRLNQLVKNGMAEKSEVTVGGGEAGKPRKLVAYAAIIHEE